MQRSDPNRRPPLSIEEKKNWSNPHKKYIDELIQNTHTMRGIVKVLDSLLVRILL